MTRRQWPCRRVAAVTLLGFLSLTRCTPPPDTSLRDGDTTIEASLPTSSTALPRFDMEKFQMLGHSLNGTPVVVNIWSSWCAPCRHEAPLLAKAARQYAGEVQFIGIDIQDRREDAVKFIREADLNYAHLFNPSGDIRDGLGFVGQPETLFYEADGDLAFTWIGPLSEQRLEHGLQLIAAE